MPLKDYECRQLSRYHNVCDSGAISCFNPDLKCDNYSEKDAVNLHNKCEKCYKMRKKYRDNCLK